MTQQQKIERKAKPRGERHDVSFDVLRTELANEEQCHAAKTHQHRYEIAQAKLFFVDQRLKDHDVHRCGVLQKDRVSGGRRFV